MWRSIAAIVAGFMMISMLSFGTDMLMRAGMPGMFDAAGRTESVPVLVLSILYVGVYAVAGCYVTARLAPGRPMRHAMILGVMGLVFGVAGTVVNWTMAPVWYHVVMLATVLPYAWLGGRLRERELERHAPPQALAT